MAQPPRITALSPADAARVLSAAAGESIGPEMIESDIQAGAPANADGSINLVFYAAWLVTATGGKH